MKFNCDRLGDWLDEKARERQRRARERKVLADKRKQEREIREAEWHDFYAIWPRKLKHGDCRAFETIRRCRNWRYTYDIFGCREKQYFWIYAAK